MEFFLIVFISVLKNFVNEVQAKPKRLRFASYKTHKVYLGCFLFAYFLKSAFGIHHGFNS